MTGEEVVLDPNNLRAQIRHVVNVRNQEWFMMHNGKRRRLGLEILTLLMAARASIFSGVESWSSASWRTEVCSTVKTQPNVRAMSRSRDTPHHKKVARSQHRVCGWAGWRKIRTWDMERLGVVAVLEGFDAGVHDTDLVEIGIGFDGCVIHCHDSTSPCLHEDLRTTRQSGAPSEIPTMTISTGVTNLSVYKLWAVERQVF